MDAVVDAGFGPVPAGRRATPATCTTSRTERISDARPIRALDRYMPDLPRPAERGADPRGGRRPGRSAGPGAAGSRATAGLAGAHRRGVSRRQPDRAGL